MPEAERAKSTLIEKLSRLKMHHPPPKPGLAQATYGGLSNPADNSAAKAAIKIEMNRSLTKGHNDHRRNQSRIPAAFRADMHCQKNLPT